MRIALHILRYDVAFYSIPDKLCLTKFTIGLPNVAFLYFTHSYEMMPVHA